MNTPVSPYDFYFSSILRIICKNPVSKIFRRRYTETKDNHCMQLFLPSCCKDVAGNAHDCWLLLMWSNSFRVAAFSHPSIHNMTAERRMFEFQQDETADSAFITYKT